MNAINPNTIINFFKISESASKNILYFMKNIHIQYATALKHKSSHNSISAN